ncbi:glucose-6-phosphatase catalytic subunit 1 [Schistocerca gregaria]|uniref:glucose-6-phosphatase catalytic subunit 1 n=1 Tax=Schistocerca gregaria TaxID=7010 RepID=UPI00211F29A2|nr:glucose-6-phosphatase catalytic subunit 1 [Schistocerca gregaria]
MLHGLYEVGAAYISSLQNGLKPLENVLLKISSASDPATVVSTVFPLVVAFDPQLSAEVLIVSTTAEWLNTLLKWLFMEHRPYWWVREQQSHIMLQQTHMTCETGPGSPSGHVMGTTAVLYIFLCWFINTVLLPSTGKSAVRKMLLIILSLTAFMGTVALVAVSRMYIAAHFPHQCILGFICGVAVSWLVKKLNWWRTAGRLKLTIAAACLTAVSVASYWLQKIAGVDPQWSVYLALKWCFQEENVNITTTPLFSLVRVAGTTFGVALSAPVFRLRKSQRPVKAFLASYVAALLIAGASETVTTSNVFIFYPLQFLLFTLQPWLLFKIIPEVM